jgi:hypothetical protein
MRNGRRCRWGCRSRGPGSPRRWSAPRRRSTARTGYPRPRPRSPECSGGDTPGTPSRRDRADAGPTRRGRPGRPASDLTGSEYKSNDLRPNRKYAETVWLMLPKGIPTGKLVWTLVAGVRAHHPDARSAGREPSPGPRPPTPRQSRSLGSCVTLPGYREPHSARPGTSSGSKRAQRARVALGRATGCRTPPTASLTVGYVGGGEPRGDTR